MNNSIIVLIITTLIVALLLNFIIPHIFIPLANDKEKEAGKDLGFKGNLMRLMVYNSSYPLSSCVYLLVLVFISVLLGTLIKIKPSVMKSLY